MSHTLFNYFDKSILLHMTNENFPANYAGKLRKIKNFTISYLFLQISIHAHMTKIYKSYPMILCASVLGRLKIDLISQDKYLIFSKLLSDVLEP